MREPRLALVLLTFLVMLSMALVAFLLACMPQKISEKFDSTHRDSPLDGLRGVLATFVFAHHFYLMYRWNTEGQWSVADNFGLHWMYFAQNLGAIPVSLFFMITGFLFLNKLKQKEINWKNLYIARIRRIMPLYLLSLLFVVYASFKAVGVENVAFWDGADWLFHWATFRYQPLNGFISFVSNAGVQWTLLYEWGFYFSLPFIHTAMHQLPASNKKQWGVMALCGALFVWIITQTDTHHYWQFVLSAAAVSLSDVLLPFIRRYKKWLNVALPLLLLATAFLFPPYTPINRILVALLFLLLAGGYDFGGILRHHGMKMLGDMSYSIYLTHGVVLYSVFVLGGWFNFQAHGLLVYIATFPLIFVLVLLLSCTTYFGVERSFLRKRQ
ncbi:acyltransferase [Kingella oralis]|uniref:acyltransferase family protein n=1 Tax=Kingella oralis TaxID=505 RepID=UPI002D80DC53|nr:acyltransferase [Kingella oralis]